MFDVCDVCVWCDGTRDAEEAEHARKAVSACNGAVLEIVFNRTFSLHAHPQTKPSPRTL